VKIVFKKGTLKRSLRECQWALGAAGLIMLSYCGYALADSWMFQNRENRLLEQLLHDRQAASGAPVNGGVISTASLTSAHRPLPAMTRGLIGRIDIARLGVSVIVIEGTGGKVLRRAVGHIPGTALPGQPGNVAISGHRDTFFRPLRNIRRDDIITLTTLLGKFRYRVVSTRIVSPNDVTVLDPSKAEVLTLVTCYPFYYVGSAPDRFIVRAERVI
jgi:sortase A